MKKSLSILGRGLLDWIVPPICWTCRRSVSSGNPLCDVCAGHLTNDPVPVCPRCASSLAEMTAAANVCPRCLTETFAFDAVVRLGPYDDIHRQLVLRMKRSEGEALAEAIAPLLARAWIEKIQRFAVEGVYAIPLHWRRRWSRGYNAPDVFALALAQALQLSSGPGGIRRIKNTDDQKNLRLPEDRKANVRGAFASYGSLDLTGKVVALVDDVLTTGATAHEASKVLKKAGAKSVVVCVIAHESPRDRNGKQARG